MGNIRSFKKLVPTQAQIILALRAGGVEDWRDLCRLSGMPPDVLRRSTTSELMDKAKTANAHVFIRGLVRCHTCRHRLSMVPCVVCTIKGRNVKYTVLEGRVSDDGEDCAPT